MPISKRVGSGGPPPYSCESNGYRKPGRKGNGLLQDYIFPVIRMIRKGIPHEKAFRKQAEALDVRYQTVNAQCTRALGIKTTTFVTKVRDGRIVALLRKRYPKNIRLIETELGPG